MSGIAKFLVAMGNGYMDTSQKTEDRKRQRETDDLRNKLLRMQIDSAEIDRDNKFAIATAGQDRAPALNDPSEVVGPPALMVGKFGMDGVKSFSPMDVTQANEYAAKQNTPAAKEARTIAAMGRVDPTKALDYKQKVAELADKTFNSGLIQASTDPVTLTKFMSDSHADGVGGAMKFEPKIEPDGSWQTYQVHPDGRKTPFGQKFEPGEKGMMTAAYLLHKGISPEQRLAHFNAVEDRIFARGIAERKMKNEEKDTENKGIYYGATVESEKLKAQREAAERSTKIPEAVKLEIEGIDKQIKSYNDALQETPVDKAIKQGLMRKRAAILRRYSPDGGQVSAQEDPFNWRGRNQTNTKSAAKPSKFASTPDEMNIALSLSSELEAANSRLSQYQQGTDEWRRAKGDVDSVLFEMKKHGIAPDVQQQTPTAEQPVAKVPIAKMEPATQTVAPANWRAAQIGVVQPNRGGVSAGASKLDRAKANAAADVIKARAAIANEPSGRKRMVLERQLSKLLKEKYNIAGEGDEPFSLEMLGIK
jgi:hypothetical protein